MNQKFNFTKQSDQVHVIQLPTQITSATWDKLVVRSGEPINIKVQTLFVGNHSPVHIAIKDKFGKAIHSVSDKILKNRFKCSFIVPKSVKDAIYYEVSLPKHKLKLQSNPIRVLPPAVISNARWGQTEAGRGDIVKVQAITGGILDGTEVMIEIFEHDQDGAHDFITKLPAQVKQNKISTEWEFEYHDDTDDIPTAEELKEKGGSYANPEYFFLVKVGKFEAKSGLLKFKDWIEIELLNTDETFQEGKEFTLILSDGTKKQGKLDKHGVARIDHVPPGKYDFGFNED